MRPNRPPNLRLLLLQHNGRDGPTKDSVESLGSIRRTRAGQRKTNAGRGWDNPGHEATESGSGRRNGNRRLGPSVGIRLGFLRGRGSPHPRAPWIISGIGRKRESEEPSAGTLPKKRRKSEEGTRPIISMMLHLGKKKVRIRALLDTGCSVALINKQTVERLGIEKRRHQQEQSIENYTGEKVEGAGQFYTKPMLLQHRRHYT